MGPDGLRKATESAILNANFMASRLKDYYPIVFTNNNGLLADYLLSSLLYSLLYFNPFLCIHILYYILISSLTYPRISFLSYSINVSTILNLLSSSLLYVHIYLYHIRPLFFIHLSPLNNPRFASPLIYILPPYPSFSPLLINMFSSALLPPLALFQNHLSFFYPTILSSRDATSPLPRHLLTPPAI